MLNPSERLFTFERIADDLSNGKARQKNRISNLLISDLWDGEFDPQNLFWNEYNARLVLDPGELPDDIPPSPDDFQETSREKLYGLLSIVGERFASDRANFPRLAQIKLRQYSDDAQVIFRNVAIPGDEVCHFRDRHGLKRSKRYEQAPPQETQQIGSPAQNLQPNKGGRRPASQSQTQEVWKEFDRVTKPELLTFTRGEITKIARGIAEKTGYKSNTVEKLIRSAYWDLEEKRPSA